MIEHAKEVLKEVRKDGDIDAIVYNIPDTGAADTGYQISHNLGREPVGCLLQLKDRACDAYKGSTWSANTIEVKFTVANTNVNIRIW